MKPIPALLLSLTLCTTLDATSNASEINMSWQWQSTDGQHKHFQLTTDDQVMAASRHEMSLLEASLTNPLETLYAYISPRLYNSINLINQSSPRPPPSFAIWSKPSPCGTTAWSRCCSGKPTNSIRRMPSTR